MVRLVINNSDSTFGNFKYKQQNFIISRISGGVFLGSNVEAIKHLSKDLGINEDSLLREGIIEYIKSKIKACMRDRLEIMSRYQVSSLDEFEKRLKEGSIPEHPGWEDLIILENLENSINKLRAELSHVEKVPIS